MVSASMSPLHGRHQGEIMPESLLNFSSSEVGGIVCGPWIVACPIKILQPWQLWEVSGQHVCMCLNICAVWCHRQWYDTASVPSVEIQTLVFASDKLRASESSIEGDSRLLVSVKRRNKDCGQKLVRLAALLCFGVFTQSPAMMINNSAWLRCPTVSPQNIQSVKKRPYVWSIPNIFTANKEIRQTISWKSPLNK